MLTRMDRIVLAVPDRDHAARGWVRLLGAEHERDDHVLGAVRSSYRLGGSRVDLLSPEGSGPITEAVSRRGPHLFCAGVATEDFDAIVRRVRDAGVDATAEGAEVWLWPDAPIVVSRERDDGGPVGDVDHLYEVTDLRADPDEWASRYAGWFDLDAAAFVPISSDRYGYAGTLTLFDDGRLDRFEVIHPHDRSKTMGRFFDKHGEVLYMAFAEAADVAPIVERAREADAGHTVADHGDTVFLHPSELGGAMLGISRRTVAWRWSGHPDRVQPATG